MKIKPNKKTFREIKDKEEKSNIFLKKIIATKFQKETLATEVLIGKVYKKIVLTSVAKSIIKSTVSR